MGRNYIDFFQKIIPGIITPAPSNHKRTDSLSSTISTDQNKDIDPKKVAADVESTWLTSNKTDSPSKTNSSLNLEEHKINWSRQTTNRNRDKRPNKKGGYGYAHSTFYKLPYETMEEYKKEKDKAKHDAKLETISEDKELGYRPRFMKFDESEEIDKNHIRGIHGRKDMHGLQEEVDVFFGSQTKLRSSSNTPSIGITPVTMLNRRVQSDSVLFTEIPSIKKRGLTRNGSITENLNNLEKEKNTPEETPKHAEKIEMARAKSDSEIDTSICTWESLSRF